MSTVFTIVRNNLAQSADNLSWAAGQVAIVFAKKFDDTNYTLDVHCGDPGVTVKEVPGTRTTSGVTVNVTGGSTDSGYYYAEGLSAEYAAASFEGGFVQHGSQDLEEGEQWVTFPRPFLDTDYTFAPIPNDGSAYAIEGSAETTRIKVYSVGENTNFRWVAHGRRG